MGHIYKIIINMSPLFFPFFSEDKKDYMINKEKKTIKDPEIYNLTRHRDQKYSRGALFLLLQEKKKQKEILNGLTEEEQEQVLRIIEQTGELAPGEIKQLIEEFGFTPENNESARGGKDVVEGLRTS